MIIHNSLIFFFFEWKRIRSFLLTLEDKELHRVIASCLLQCPRWLQLHAREPPSPIPTQHALLLCAFSSCQGALHKQRLWRLCEMSPMSWHLGSSALGSVVCSDNRGETICSELDIYFRLLLPKHPRTASYREGQALGLWRAGAMSHQSSDLYFPPERGSKANRGNDSWAEPWLLRNPVENPIARPSELLVWLELTECIFK